MLNRKIDSLLHTDDLASVANVVLRYTQTISNRASQIQEGDSPARNEYGRRNLYKTPKGKLFVFHESWHKDESSPRELMTWFNSGQFFSFLIYGMKSPSRKMRQQNHATKSKRDKVAAASSARDYRRAGADDPSFNLIAVNGDRDLLLIQLAIYAARDEQLSPDANNAAFCLFERRFRDFGCFYRPCVLEDTWLRLIRCFDLPIAIDGFERYVRSTIKNLNRMDFDADEFMLRRSGTEIVGEYHIEDATPLEAAVREKVKQAVVKQHRPIDIDLLTPRQAARLKGIPERTFYWLIKKKRLPTTTLGTYTSMGNGWEEAADAWLMRRARATNNKTFVRAWAMKQNISETSANTQIKRWRSKCFDEKEIGNRIGREWIEKACRD